MLALVLSQPGKFVSANAGHVRLWTVLCTYRVFRHIVGVKTKIGALFHKSPGQSNIPERLQAEPKSGPDCSEKPKSALLQSEQCPILQRRAEKCFFTLLKHHALVL